MKNNTQKLVGIGVLTAIVVALQFLSMAIRFSNFSVTLSLIPIVVGAALYGKGAGAWLGLAFGITVLATGDASAFLTVNPIGTFITVLGKGILAGFSVGLVYELIQKKNKAVATYVSGVICPIVNTGVFLICCFVFFLDTIKGWAEGFGFGDDYVKYMILGLVGINFLFELAINLILSPTIVRLIDLIQKKIKK